MRPFCRAVSASDAYVLNRVMRLLTCFVDYPVCRPDSRPNLRYALNSSFKPFLNRFVVRLMIQFGRRRRIHSGAWVADRRDTGCRLSLSLPLNGDNWGICLEETSSPSTLTRHDGGNGLLQSDEEASPTTVRPFDSHRIVPFRDYRPKYRACTEVARLESKLVPLCFWFCLLHCLRVFCSDLSRLFGLFTRRTGRHLRLGVRLSTP